MFIERIFASSHILIVFIPLFAISKIFSHLFPKNVKTVSHLRKDIHCLWCNQCLGEVIYTIKIYIYKRKSQNVCVTPFITQEWLYLF